MLWLLALACAPPPQAQTSACGQFVAYDQAGTARTWAHTPNQEIPSTWREESLGETDLNGETILAVEATGDFGTLPFERTSWYSCDEAGAWYHGADLRKGDDNLSILYDDPVLRIPAEVELGSRWVIDTVGWLDFNGTAEEIDWFQAHEVVGRQWISVPAGGFLAWKVKITTRRESTTGWLVEGHGFVWIEGDTWLTGQ